jgi:hypothetical protein
MSVLHNIFWDQVINSDGHLYNKLWTIIQYKASIGNIVLLSSSNILEQQFHHLFWNCVYVIAM